MTRSSGESRPTGATSADEPPVGASSRVRRPEPLPERLRSPRAKLVYLYLRTVGEAKVADLQQALRMPALTAYPILEILVDDGLVARTDGGYVATTERHE